MKNFKTQTYSEQVAEYIREQILSGRLLPGSPILEAAIAEELSISRAPVREAMQFLIREGLIEAHPQKRKHVRALTAKQIRNSYFTGGVLEAAAVAEALPRYTAENIGKLTKIVENMKAVADGDGSVAEQAPLDDAFHDLLFSRVDNEHLIELCKYSCQGISKFLLFRHWVKLYSAAKVYERHQKILDALQSGNPRLVESTIRDHYFSAGERMAVYGVDVYRGEQGRP